LSQPLLDQGDIKNKTAKKAPKHSLVTLASSKRKYSGYKKPGRWSDDDSAQEN